MEVVEVETTTVMIQIVSSATVTAPVHPAGHPAQATPVYILNTRTVSTVSTIPGFS